MLHAAVPFATFDIIWWWVGLGLPTGEYTLYGKNKKCYNFPGLFAYPTGSPISESPLLPTPIIPFFFSWYDRHNHPLPPVILTAPARPIRISPLSPGCWVYRAANCLGGEDGIFTGVGSEGYQIYDGDSQSLICAKST
ncbi:hypothetical protein JHW43_000644 [Diplocarpon mali]|nr:hypothetical protein JHW43_000644 [Diplocarpon mali]